MPALWAIPLDAAPDHVLLHSHSGGSVVSSMYMDRKAVAHLAKATAAWALTNGLRNELRAQGTLVTAVHAGYINTDLVASLDVPKSRPEDIAKRVIEALQVDSDEVLADDMSMQAKAGLVSKPPLYIRAQD